MGGEPEQSFERNVPMEAAIIAKDEFVEIEVDVFSAQPVICAEAPSLHQRKGAINPGQGDVACHLADDAWIVPVADQSRIGRVAVGDQRGRSRFTLAFTKADKAPDGQTTT